jgi:hypothetical protein
VTDRGGRAARNRSVRLLALLVLALIGCGETSAADEIPAARETRAPFVPDTHRDGGRTVLPLTFPDGTRATITYPHELDIAGLGVIPYGSALLHGDSPHPDRDDRVGRDLRIVYGPYREADPTSLQLRFGRWTVLVWDFEPGHPGAMTPEERRDFAASLSGRVTGDGFLVLEASPPLRLAEAGEHAGPSLWFGMSRHAPWLLLFLQPCGPKAESTSRGFASWCLSDSVIAHAYGGRRFIAAATNGIELS